MNSKTKQARSDDGLPALSKFIKKHSRSGDGPVIVQILPALVRGGVERGTIEMAEATINAGGRAVVISNGGGMERYLTRFGATHYQLPVHVKNPFEWMFLRRQVAAILEKEGADIVHVRSRVPAWIALPVARRMGLTTISTVHGRFVPNSPFKRFYNGKMLAVDHVIAISNYVKNLITQNYFGVEERLSVVHRGVDTRIFDSDNVSQSRVIRFVDAFDLPEDTPIIMLPARATAWKGHEILLEALATIQDLPFLCVFLGAADGHHAFVERLTRKGISLGLEGRFRLLKGVEDMPAALKVADVVVMPSITPEPFGRVALEAQAMGRPVIAFNHGGAAESIIHETTGWLATPNDAADLGRCIAQALTLGPSQRRTLAKATRAHILKSFSTAKMCRETIRIYARLLAKASLGRTG